MLIMPQFCIPQGGHRKVHRGIHRGTLGWSVREKLTKNEPAWAVWAVVERLWRCAPPAAICEMLQLRTRSEPLCVGWAIPSGILNTRPIWSYWRIYTPHEETQVPYLQLNLLPKAGKIRA